MQVAQLAHLARVRAMTILPGDFENRREPLEARVGEEDAELVTEHPFADVRVPIPVRPAARGRIVHVQGSKAVEPDRVLDFVEAGIEGGGIGDVGSGHPEMAGVETDAGSRGAP
jgi:hypothetical protein